MKLGLLFINLVLLIVLSGCGNNGGTTSTSPIIIVEKTGVFIDNVVFGIKYKNGTYEGFTNENGEFTYRGGRVEFYIGNIKIGELNSLPEDGRVFIQDIVGIERTNIDDERVLKIAMLLQSLDSNILTDRIEILKSDLEKFDSINENIEDIDLKSIVESQGFVLVSKEDAQRHLKNVLEYYLSEDKEELNVNSSIVSGSSDISISPSILLIFLEDIPKGVKKYIKVKESESEIPFTLSHKYNEVTIELSDLKYLTEYKIEISNELKSYSNNKLPTDILISFSTQEEPDITAPTFENLSEINVNENQTDALFLSATDDRSSVTYSISGIDADFFNIDSVTGEITFKLAPDYEVKNQYFIIATATDTSSNFSTQNITININDIDDTAPVFTSSNIVSVDENQIIALTVNATDTATITYTISGVDASSFNIDSISGEITFKAAPDYEVQNQYSITVTATDSFLNFSTQNITIDINDVYEGITIIDNTISYITVKSPITGKIWLDRNLGATQVCTKSREEFTSDAEYIADQKSCFGDYYQWGRLSDGHEKETSIVSSIQATDIKNAGADFISSSSSYSYDWARDSDEDKSLREIQWAKTDGSSVCPIGFRVPTSQELSAETIDYTGNTDESTGAVKIVNRDTAFKNFLKLPVAGIRINTNGTVSNQGDLGSLWSNSNDSVYFEENSSSSNINSFTSYGFSVRCIEDENLNPTANAGEDNVVTLGTNIEFDAINSSDSDSSISFYEWKEGSTVLSLSQNFSKSDFSLGEHTITLIITDDAGAKDFAKINIEVVPVNVTHNSLTYNLVVSPITKRVWLDRNIGATSVCSKSRADFGDSNDYVLDQQSCFGDLYQWGRLTDGHEKRTSSSTSTTATSITNAGTDFIISVDWLDGYIGGATRVEQWSKTDATSICPIGFRVPTRTELYEDTILYDGIDDYVTGAVDIKNADTAFKNFLKIPFPGTRNEYSGSIERSGVSGSIWTATTSGTWSARALYINISDSGGSILQFGRGASVRCIRD